MGFPEDVKKEFGEKLSAFADTLGDLISKDGDWTIKGFIDIFQNIHTISNDTKIVSKILELHLFPYLLSFAENNGYKLELATYQNWYPDLTFISKDDPGIKFAVDLKTSYRIPKHPEFCNGFTLGSHGEYFVNRDSTKNIQYPYCEYLGHFCLGIIYSRSILDKSEEIKIYPIKELEAIPSVIHQFIFFACEKWMIASDKSGSGNTANIGSIRRIKDIQRGNGRFRKAGENLFNEYWINYGKIQVIGKNGKTKKLTSLPEYLKYRGLPAGLYNRGSQEAEEKRQWKRRKYTYHRLKSRESKLNLFRL